MRSTFFYALLTCFFLGGIGCSQNKSNEKKQKHTHTNALINETSPYLLQHAHNPVNWHPWSQEVLARAQKENKLVIISVGYAACHWCHVMEEESFEDEEVARLMNNQFISIKVDREERPDVDKVYMKAVQLITGRGGWPLNVIALPDGRPVYGGTYFTKAQWLKVLKSLSDGYQNQPQQLTENATNLTKAVQAVDLPLTAEDQSIQMSDKDWQAMANVWKNNWDLTHGGGRRVPKFMMPNRYDFLMYYSHALADKSLDDFVKLSLDKMALGGLYDQVGGGFARYATDKKWHIPHFEKMLYDNAQLISTYAEAYQYFKKPLYQKVILETIAFMERRLFSQKDGLFYTSIDADSEGEEGAYYVWTVDELKDVLGNDFKFFTAYYPLKTSFWEGDKYVLMAEQSEEAFAKKRGLEITSFKRRLKKLKKRLLKVRQKRVPPRTDDKMLSAMNALAVCAYCKAYRALGKRAFKQRAIALMGNMLRKFVNHDTQELYRSYQKGVAKLDAYLQDYALMIKALIDVYQITFKAAYLKKAVQLTEQVRTNFWSAEHRLFYFTNAKNSKKLIARNLPIDDNVIPSGNAVMAMNLHHLGLFYGKPSYLKQAKQMLAKVTSKMIAHPRFYSKWARLALQINRPFYELAVVGKDAEREWTRLQSSYLPQIIVVGSVKPSYEIPLLANRFVQGKTLWYVCSHGFCKLPTEKLTVVKKQLGK